jgi:hypothetical protein
MLASNSQSSSLSLPIAGITGVHCYVLPPLFNDLRKENEAQAANSQEREKQTALERWP